jgi:hypothetical protein
VPNLLKQLRGAKDTLLSGAIKATINSHIKEYGTMLKFNLDSDNKSIDMEVMLDGEVEPLTIHVDRYELITEGDHSSLSIHGVHTSRKWINVLAGSYLDGKRFDIPAQYVKMLETVI